MSIYTDEEIREHRKQWIAALRSGQYQQTQGCLRALTPGSALSTDDTPVGYCCLGVACEIAGVPTRESGRLMLYDGSSQLLPPSVQEWLGVNDESPDVIAEVDNDNGPQLIPATELNDIHEWDFRQIADAFEDYWGLA